MGIGRWRGRKEERMEGSKLSQNNYLVIIECRNAISAKRRIWDQSFK